MDKNLGVILKARRQERGLTLTQLGSLAGIHPSHVGRLEQGKRSLSGPILRKLVKPLGFGETELLKIAGFMSEDAFDVDKLKQKIKEEITDTLTNLCRKIDRL